jgi:DNA-directed RNA polymerase subunit RPC12/RpoP
MSEEKSFVSFVCSTCRQEIETSTSMIGQTVECPACGAKLVVAPQEQTSTQAQQDAMKSRTIRIELSDL